jgi:hypothetical protein
MIVCLSLRDNARYKLKKSDNKAALGRQLMGRLIGLITQDVILRRIRHRFDTSHST